MEMASTQPIIYGMTSPVSLQGPKEVDVLRTKELEDTLRAEAGIFDTEEGINSRLVFLQISRYLFVLVRELSSLQTCLPSFIACFQVFFFFWSSWQTGTTLNSGDL